MRHVAKMFSHRFLPGFFGLVGGRRMTRYVRFDYSCKYSLPGDDQLDINKLFGIGFFPHHHKNSARFGWRWNAEKNMVEIHAYVYSKGVRSSYFICDVRVGAWVQYTLQVGSGSYSFEVISATGKRASKMVYVKPLWTWLGYKLGPYFGGNLPAPHNMTIEIRKSV